MTKHHKKPNKNISPKSQDAKPLNTITKTTTPKEHGGAKGLEPTRYGDWERNGRCTDF